MSFLGRKKFSVKIFFGPKNSFLAIRITIAKNEFFGPKKIFCENLLQPSFIYDDTLLSCNNPEKNNDPIFHKVQKTPYLAVFWPKFAPQIFFSKFGLCHIRGFIHL